MHPPCAHTALTTTRQAMFWLEAGSFGFPVVKALQPRSHERLQLPELVPHAVQD